MKLRIFVAVSVPEMVQKEIVRWQRHHAQFEVRWTGPENLHITVVPPWYVDENELYEAAKEIGRTAEAAEPFEVVFEKTLFGPPGQTPRLIWAEGEDPEEFKSFKISTEKALLQNPKTGFLKQESRPAKLHLTLARFKPGSIHNLPPLNDRIDWRFEAEEVALMRSELKRGGAEYSILQKFNL